MSSLSLAKIIESAERITAILNQWGVSSSEWSVLDGPAIKLLVPDFDASAWRDHLNIYIREAMLPWTTKERELTVPPLGSKELSDVLSLTRAGTIFHLVPAERYYAAGFERQSAPLPSGAHIQAATLRGCSQVWSYKSVEIVERMDDYEGDSQRIFGERLVRLQAALARAEEDDIRERILLLIKGYLAVDQGKFADAKRLFRVAAGEAWKLST